MVADLEELSTYFLVQGDCAEMEFGQHERVKPRDCRSENETVEEVTAWLIPGTGNLLRTSPHDRSQQVKEDLWVCSSSVLLKWRFVLSLGAKDQICCSFVVVSGLAAKAHLSNHGNALH